MPLGDDDRRTKSRQHREAAKARWEGRAERARRRTTERAVDGANWVLTAAMVVLILPLTAVRWLGGALRVLDAQAEGTWRNLRAFWAWLALDRLLPSGIRDQISEVIALFPKALGLRDTSPRSQFASATILIILSLLATFLSGGLLIGVVAFFGLFWLIALVRLNPAANDQWQAFRSRLPVRNDYDVVGWSRE